MSTPAISVITGRNINRLALAISQTGINNSGVGGVVDISNLPNLTLLTASGIGMTQLLGMANCPKLATAVISQNSLGGAVPNLALNTGLTQLTAFANNYTGITQTNFTNNGNLAFYLVYRCPLLSGTVPTGVALLTGLQQFSVNQCSLTGTITAPQAKNLNIFNIYSNNFTGTFPDISFMTGVKTMGANNNNITGFAGGLPTGINGCVFNFNTNKLQPSAISGILQAAVNSTSTSCTLNIAGGSNARATGTVNLNNISTLQSRGWTVTYNA